MFIELRLVRAGLHVELDEEVDAKSALHVRV
jgi:hypothetical protein